VIVAIALMIVIAILPNLIWPPKQPVRPLAGRPDSAIAAESARTQLVAPKVEAPSLRPPARLSAFPADTVWVTSSLYRLGFSTRGGTLVSAQLARYRSFAAGDASPMAQLVPSGLPFLEHRVVVGPDTVSLADLSFTPSAQVVRVGGDPAAVTFTAKRGDVTFTLTYRFLPDQYRLSVEGHISSLSAGGAQVLVGLGHGLRNTELDSLTTFRDYAVVTKSTKTEKQAFASMKEGERVVLNGPFEWAAVKSKYFLLAALALQQNQPQFGGVVATGGPRPDSTTSMFGGKSGIATQAAVWLTLPTPPAGDFRYDLYLGPLEHRNLAALGHDLDDANPYGGFLRPLIKPVSEVAFYILLWMHERLHLAYGLALILFGILIRVLLWPLNQKAMESSIRMQAVAPLIKEIQAKHKNEPEKLQKETLRLYREHQVNPLGGCLPMLIPMPVLFALFFVFANTIEFRGVPFLWLPDLSRADPVLVIPLLMGLSMFGLSKIGQIGVPPNPQTKTMLYMMPVMMTFIFLRLSSGLNLYYLVSNLCSIPQQWMIAQRRLREQGKRAPSS
jgi:YidC/Oxa1 family membrane protein insertase